MRVLLLVGDIDVSPLALTAALERDSSVSQVEISDDIRNAPDADLTIVRGGCSPEPLAPRPGSGNCVRVVLADHATADDRIRLLEDGADVVLPGDAPDDEIVAQVRAIARRRTAPRSEVASAPVDTDKIVLDADRRHAAVLGRRITLTLLEGNLLATFMARPAEVLDRRALMTSVWGAPFGARSTVSAYIRRLRVKVEPDPSNPVFIRTVWAGGYVYRPDGEP
jgi:DNA-binding response OmpR family regulator